MTPATSAATTTTTNIIAFDPTRLNIYTAREWLAETELCTLGLLLEPEKALAGDAERAAEVARLGGVPFNAAGRYPALVWMQVYPE